MRRAYILLIGAVALAIANPISARADLKKKQARKIIQTMAGFSLPSSSVQVQSINSNTADSAEVNAEIEMVFRLRLFEGHWQLREIRTGQDRWERLELIARAANVSLPEGECDAPSEFARRKSLTELSTKRARCLVASLFGVTLPSDEVRVKEITPFGLSIGSESSALIIALVDVNLRLKREARNWHVAEFKSGARDWVDVSNLPALLDAEKRLAASNDLTIIASALRDFRRDRGYFVVSDKESVLIDHLSPRYLVRVIRVDPWHRAYRYEGQTDRYSLRSLGPDGKANTPDDIVVAGP